MTANKFWEHRNAPQGSTTATRKPTPQEVRAACTDRGVDYHVEQATAKE